MDIIEGNYQALLDQNKELQGELALYKKIVELIISDISELPEYKYELVLNNYKQKAIQELTDASI